MDAITILVLIVIAVVPFLFIGGIVWAGMVSLQNKPEKMDSLLAGGVTAIGGLLSTNFGLVLGLYTTGGLQPVGRSIQSFSLNPATWTSITTQTFQVVAAYVYLFGLLIACIFYFLNRRTAEPTKVVDIVPQLTKMLVGVTLAVLAITLGISDL